MKRALALLTISTSAALLLTGCNPLEDLPIPGKEKSSEETTSSTAPSSSTKASTSKSSTTKSSTSRTSTPKSSASKSKMDDKLQGALEALLEPDLEKPKTDTASGTLNFDKTTGELKSITDYKVNGAEKEVPAERLEEVRKKIKAWKPTEVDKVRMLEFDYKNNFINVEYYG